MLEWTSTICGMIGAALCAIGLQSIGYPVFLIGSIAAVLAFRNGNVAMLIQFWFFSLCNLIGVFNFSF